MNTEMFSSLLSENNSAPKEQADKKLARAFIDASHQCLYDHYERRDIDAVMSYMDADVVWLGPLDCQHCRGIDAMRTILLPEYPNIMRMSDERWEARRMGDAWLVFGMLTVETEGLNPVGVFHQSVTFIWSQTPQGARVVHLQVANAHDIPPRTAAPLVLGQNAVEYSVESFAATREARKEVKLSFQSLAGTMNYLAPEELLCFEVEGGQTIRVVHQRGEFQIRGAMSELEDYLPKEFVRTHRSCIVNADHVLETVRFEVLLTNDVRCPIAEKRYREVCQTIESAAH